MDASIWSNELIEVCFDILTLFSILKPTVWKGGIYCFTQKKTEHTAAKQYGAVTVNLMFLMFLCIMYLSGIPNICFANKM